MGPGPISGYLADLHARVAPNHSGSVATYIPELAKVNPDQLGIALVTVDGRAYAVGHTTQAFTIQSVSKVFTYGMLLQSANLERVMAIVGIEPSGDAFNSISLDPQSGRPVNPMINAGAIAVSSQLTTGGALAAEQRILQAFGQYAGRPLSIDQSVYQSEKTTGHRNRAIAHLLLNNSITTGDPELGLDLYFKQCSILVDCLDLARMAATLANDGVNPVTREAVIDAPNVSRMLSVMASCGMYDFSGQWIYEIGIPAKSGVGGGIMLVMPGYFGLAVFSPRLDAKGNSVRGIEVCKALSEELGLNVLQRSRSALGAVIRDNYTLANFSSRRARKPEIAAQLAAVAENARVIELTGALNFYAAELLSQTALSLPPGLQYLIFDFRHVSSFERAAAKLLASLIDELEGANILVFFTDTARLEEFGAIGEDGRALLDERAASTLANLDKAIELVEDWLLQAMGIDTDLQQAVGLSGVALCADLSAADQRYLTRYLTACRFNQGEYLTRAGEQGEHLHLLLDGRVSLLQPLEGGSQERVETVDPSGMIGPASLVGHEPQPFNVFAESDVATLRVDCAALLADRSPDAQRIALHLIRGCAATAMSRLQKALRQLYSKV